MAVDVGLFQDIVNVGWRVDEPPPPAVTGFRLWHCAVEALGSNTVQVFGFDLEYRNEAIADGYQTQVLNLTDLGTFADTGLTAHAAAATYIAARDSSYGRLNNIYQPSAVYPRGINNCSVSVDAGVETWAFDPEEFIQEGTYRRYLGLTSLTLLDLNSPPGGSVTVQIRAKFSIPIDFAAPSGNAVIFALNHGIADGAQVTIANSSLYNGDYFITLIDLDHFILDGRSYLGDDAGDFYPIGAPGQAQSFTTVKASRLQIHTSTTFTVSNIAQNDYVSIVGNPRYNGTYHVFAINSSTVFTVLALYEGAATGGRVIPFQDRRVIDKSRASREIEWAVTGSTGFTDNEQIADLPQSSVARLNATGHGILAGDTEIDVLGGTPYDGTYDFPGFFLYDANRVLLRDALFSASASGYVAVSPPTYFTSAAHGQTGTIAVTLSNTDNYDGAYTGTVIDVDRISIPAKFVGDDAKGDWSAGGDATAVLKSTAHGLFQFDGVVITGSALYDGAYGVLEIIDADNFRIDTLYVGDDSGTWELSVRGVHLTSVGHSVTTGLITISNSTVPGYNGNQFVNSIIDANTFSIFARWEGDGSGDYVQGATSGSFTAAAPASTPASGTFTEVNPSTPVATGSITKFEPIRGAPFASVGSF